MTDDDNSVLVTKADRDAAFNTGVRLSKSEWLTLYEAFARHREGAIEAQAAEIKRLRKALKNITDAMHSLGGDPEYPERRKGMKQLSDGLLSAKEILGETND